jgi:hypothetical protein
MKEKQITEEISYLKLLLTIISTMFAGVTGFIGLNFGEMHASFLNLLLIVDLLLVILVVFLDRKSVV